MISYCIKLLALSIAQNLLGFRVSSSRGSWYHEKEKYALNKGCQISCVAKYILDRIVYVEQIPRQTNFRGPLLRNAF